jgi:hypothetical protein
MLREHLATNQTFRLAERNITYELCFENELNDSCWVVYVKLHG